MIELKNLNLTGVDIIEQFNKTTEENREFEIAVIRGMYDNTIENIDEAIAEFYDKVQSSLSLLNVALGLNAEYVMLQYPKHLEKIKNRPRKK